MIELPSRRRWRRQLCALAQVLGIAAVYVGLMVAIFLVCTDVHAFAEQTMPKDTPSPPPPSPILNCEVSARVAHCFAPDGGEWPPPGSGYVLAWHDGGLVLERRANKRRARPDGGR